MTHVEDVKSRVLEFATGSRRFRALGFTAPKNGYSSLENEDAFAFAVNGDQLCIAVADGATESFFSRHWSNLLVDSFVSVHHSLERRMSMYSWAKTAASEFEDSHPLENLPWHAQAKGSLGSHATFAGVVLSTITLNFRSYQVGDCMALVKGRQIHQYPNSSGIPLKFDSQPETLSTKNIDNIPYSFRSRRKPLGNSGGSIYLMSDALAESLRLGSVEANREACIVLDEITDEESFSSLIGQLRSEGRIKNDDVTFVRAYVVSR